MRVITANPKTAGVARWNFLALWGHKQKQGEGASLDYCKKASFLRVLWCRHDNATRLKRCVCLPLHALAEQMGRVCTKAKSLSMFGMTCRFAIGKVSVDCIAV